MDEVQSHRGEIIITKHGKLVAKLVPFEAKTSVSALGFLRGTVLNVDDILSPIDETWEVGMLEAN